jgi:hypothetical protein
MCQHVTRLSAEFLYTLRHISRDAHPTVPWHTYAYFKIYKMHVCTFPVYAHVERKPLYYASVSSLSSESVDIVSPRTFDGTGPKPWSALQHSKPDLLAWLDNNMEHQASC